MIRLGWTLYENNKKFAGPLAILIKINEKTVFSCYPDGTGAFHELWLERKANMVYMREMCTLRAFLELERNGEELKKDWILDAANYADMWGRISVAIENGCVVGAICVSDCRIADHQAVTEGIRLFLEKEDKFITAV